MKKCVVVEKEENKAIAVTERGEFVTVPLKTDAEVGDVLRLGLSSRILFAIVLGAFLVLNACGWGVYGGIASYWAPVTFLSVDINPSIQFTLNKSKKVVAAYGANHDGKVLLASRNFKGMEANDAVASIVHLASEAGYFDFERPQLSESPEGAVSPEKVVVPNAVMLTVASDSDGESQSVKEAVYRAVDDTFDSLGIYGVILTEHFLPEYWYVTQHYGVDLGKLQLVQLAVRCGVPFEEACAMSVKKLNAVVAKHYGDTQAALDEQAALRAELTGKISANRMEFEKQQIEIGKLDSCAFAMEKTIFLKDFATIRYEMCGKWEDFKYRWQASRREAAAA